MTTVGIKEVARRAGVSVGTVSNVLNRPDRVSSDSLARVRAAIEELGFIRNDAARQLRMGRSQTVGLVVLDVGNPFFVELARGAEERAATAGLAVLLGNSNNDPLREAAYLDRFDQQRVQGVLISPIGDVSERLERLRERGTPSVLVDRSGHETAFSSVSVDDIAGGYLAVRHLIECGGRRIAFLAGKFEIRQVTDRLEGARRAIAESPGVTLEIITAAGLSVPDGRRSGEEIASRPASLRPDSIFAVNDLMAVGVLHGLISLAKLSVPHDIAIVGYDDIDFASMTIVPLTSMRQPSHLIGATALDLLVGAVADQPPPRRDVLFQPELVVRASTAP